MIRMIIMILIINSYHYYYAHSYVFIYLATLSGFLLSSLFLHPDLQ